MTEIRELPKKGKRQLPGISGFRALAALSVVFYHLNQHRTIANLAEWNWDLYKLTELLPFVVSFFFVLGGALHSLPFWRVIFTRDSGGKEFVPEPKNALIDRFFRIAPAYYAALIASFIVVWVVQWVGWTDFLRLFSGLSFLSWVHPRTLFPVEINGPLWFISYDIMGGLLVLAVMHSLVRIPRKMILLAFTWIAGILLTLHFWFSGLPFPHLSGVVSAWFPWYNPFVFGLHFMIGMALGALWTYTEIRECRDSFWYDFLFIVVTTGFVLYLWDIRFDGIFANSYPKSPYQFPVTTLFIATSLFTITKTRFIGRMLDNRITKHIAKISYSLYLWHALVIGLLCKWFFGDEGLENITWWTLVIVTLIISIPLAWLSEKYIEQGVMNWKKKVFPK